MAAHRKKLDINSASFEELVTLPDVGPALARKIEAARPFRRLSDLRQIPGIGDKLYDQMREYVRVPRSKAPDVPAATAARQDAHERPAVTELPEADRAESVADASPLLAMHLEAEAVEPPGTADTYAGRAGDESPGPKAAGLDRLPPVDYPHVAPPDDRARELPQHGFHPSITRPELAQQEDKEQVRPIAKPTIDDVIGRALAPERGGPARSHAAPKVEYWRPQTPSWTLWAVGALGVIVVGSVLFAFVLRARRPPAPQATGVPAAAQIATQSAPPPTATPLPATAMPLASPGYGPTEATEPEQAAGIEATGAAAAAIDATPEPATATSEQAAPTETLPPPTATMSASVPYTLGDTLWAENFDPPIFNWGRGLTSIADANYVEGALQATMLTRVEPYWSIGPTYKVGASNYLYEADVIVEACTERDFYGLVFRADGQDFYAFAITCDGNFRLIRRLAGREDLLQMAQSPTIPGGPGVHRLGVLVLGKRILLFVNGQQVYDHSESRLSQIPNGDFGVFARMVSSSSLTVRWDNMRTIQAFPQG